MASILKIVRIVNGQIKMSKCLAALQLIAATGPNKDINCSDSQRVSGEQRGWKMCGVEISGHQRRLRACVSPSSRWLKEMEAECHPNVIRYTKSAIHHQSTSAEITVQGNFIEQTDSNQRVRFCFFQNRNNNIAPVPSKATVNEFVPAVEHNYSIRPQETRNEASNSRSIDETLAVHSKTAEPIIFQQPNLVNAENTIHNMIGQELNPEPVQVDVSIIPESEADELARLRCENQELQTERTNLKKLLAENLKLRDQINAMDRTRRSFLNDDQIKMLEQGRVSKWFHDSIVRGLKFRFALSVHGYQYLRGTGYPLPSYATIMRRIQDFKLDFGIFEDILQLLKFKVETMDPTDRFCVLSYDEIKISKQQDYNKNLGKFLGRATLGKNLDDLGEKVFAVVVRGVKNRWKQIVACHVTHTTSIDPQLLKDFMLDCITSVESCGLYVVALSSDLDSRNRGLWTSLNIQASRHGTINNFFVFNNYPIYAMPDACYALKNLKAAMLRQLIYLPEAYVELEKLPTHSRWVLY
ncbi:uncharacterized protein [Linepithema humile]|uniref:uncharacterized protein n=1 Tax=Linepithema humile TaxID=83485 RepID=UPI00351E6D4D